MADGAVSSASAPQHNVQWKWFLLAMWLLAALWLLANAADTLGLGGRPWYGFWDAVLMPGDRAYTMVIEGIVPGGTADRAGMHDGDAISLRDQTLDGIVAAVY
ncbi:MAG TPA: hypothetical protein VKB39_02415, partial [Candidatus Baltobacteraceae bacterium]|nr:hypothetical protein [Candidatus Baltobacteraceae bacterium]